MLERFRHSGTGSSSAKTRRSSTARRASVVKPASTERASAGGASAGKSGGSATERAAAGGASAGGGGGVAASGAPGTVVVMEEEHTFDRFASIRSGLALALRRCQKELSKQVTCSRCAAFLVRPARFIDCRHVVCELCVEQTARYFRECPVCLKSTTSDDPSADPFRDDAHER